MANGLYAQRGVSAQKEEVHRAVAQLDPGLYPHAFCKIYPDFLNGDAQWVNLMHADGAGTKSILAYLYWRETGDLTVWKGIAQDAIVMNLDDLLCTGVHERFLFSSTIDRNKQCIPGEVLQALIQGTQEFFDWLHSFGVDIHYLGGETADVGDVVRTIAVNGTLMARWPKDRLITNEKIVAGDVIVGLASSGKATYETVYNSGIASNGLTSARHDALHKTYGARFPETYDTSLDESVVYIGPYQLTDEIPTDNPLLKGLTLGQLLLSPTRTYAPVMKELLNRHFPALHGLVHCSGGGQTKCLKYLPSALRVIKDQLFDPPVIFDLLQKASGSDDREMYQVFNMGHRLEIFTPQKHASEIIQTARQFGVEAKVVGRVESSATRELHLYAKGKLINY
ncbi:MAG: AIR synthase related protein [Chitinophagaceae bacterium]